MLARRACFCVRLSRQILPLQASGESLFASLATPAPQQDVAACSSDLGELKALRGSMHLNSTHLVKAQETIRLEKAAIWEADMLDPGVRQRAPLFNELLQDATLRTLLSILMPQLRLDGQVMKLQTNAGGGGCFPIHHDSDESVDARRLTAILYLNRAWQPEHGGQLRLYPALAGQAVDIPPRAGTLVLFPACRMLHRVMPSTVERHCMTIWLSQNRPGHCAPASLRRVLEPNQWHGKTEAAITDSLLQEPEARKHFGRR
ncbi:hypothetical protein WJX73_007149 [Symbiochloris irregularis]|uniref:Fe2OG dioxygenase domain-containing protein n=1 Tax=Symbiochloris irregularis TaxID=706552 RepID=A0AAW1NPN0_9CHLO